MKKRKSEKPPEARANVIDYDSVLNGLVELLESARRSSARAVNRFMTATCWEVGRRIVEGEQGGESRAEYGKALFERLSADLTRRFGRGFSRPNLQNFRQFFLTYPEIRQTVSGELADEKLPTASRELVPRGGSTIAALGPAISRFRLPWSSYVRLLSVRNEKARQFYETEAIRCGWNVRQLDRQISSQFYERTALSRNKAAMLRKSRRSQPADDLSADEENWKIKTTVG